MKATAQISGHGTFRRWSSFPNQSYFGAFHQISWVKWNATAIVKSKLTLGINAAFLKYYRKFVSPWQNCRKQCKTYYHVRSFNHSGLSTGTRLFCQRAFNCKPANSYIQHDSCNTCSNTVCPILLSFEFPQPCSRSAAVHHFRSIGSLSYAFM